MKKIAKFSLVSFLVGALSSGLVVASPASAASVRVDPIISLQAASVSVAQVPQWAQVAARHRTQESGSQWSQLLATVAAVDRAYLLTEVNRLVNQARYRSESGDQWSTPSELLANGGDCEDYAIAKYLLLRAMGVSADDMRILILRANGNVGEHAVLVVQTSAGPYVLDNRRQNPYAYGQDTAVSAAYAFNDRSMFIPLGNTMIAGGQVQIAGNR